VAGVFVERQRGAIGEIRPQQADVAEFAIRHLTEEGERAPRFRDAGRPVQDASDDGDEAGAAMGRGRAFEHRHLLGAKTFPFAAEASALQERRLS
jgi:hypothetical protein